MRRTHVREGRTHQEEEGDRIQPGSGTSSPRGPSAYEASERAPRAGEMSMETTIIFFRATLSIFCC